MEESSLRSTGDVGAGGEGFSLAFVRLMLRLKDSALKELTWAYMKIILEGWQLGRGVPTVESPRVYTRPRHLSFLRTHLQA